MKIGIDARFIGPQGTGLGKYTEELIENLQKIDNYNQYFIFLKQDNWQELKLKNHNFKKVLADISWYSFEEQIKMPGIFNRCNLDLLHIPHFNVPVMYRGKFVVTIHDFIHHEFFQESSTSKNPIIFKIKRAAYKITIANAVKNSAKIFVPSNFVKSEVTKYFKVNPDKVVVTYEAAEDEYFANSKKDYTSKIPRLLYIGNLYPHKNILRLLDAVKILKKVELEIVCPRDIFFKRLTGEISKRGIETSVKTFGYLKSSELKKLFSKTSIYITPSLSEGFGIPGLNAMAAHVVVLSSDIPPYREIYKNASIYFNPNDENDMVEKINKVINNQELRDKHIKIGSELAKKYSWQKMAQETLDVYRNL